MRWWDNNKIEKLQCFSILKILQNIRNIRTKIYVLNVVCFWYINIPYLLTHTKSGYFWMTSETFSHLLDDHVSSVRKRFSHHKEHLLFWPPVNCLIGYTGHFFYVGLLCPIIFASSIEQRPKLVQLFVEAHHYILRWHVSFQTSSFFAEPGCFLCFSLVYF